jgi:prepilin-type N-terminal cleavage/methylation domain-containing protein
MPSIFQRGFSFIELLLSLSILSISLLGLLRLQLAANQYAYSAFLFGLAQTQAINAAAIPPAYHAAWQPIWNAINQQLLPTGKGGIATQAIQLAWTEPDGSRHINFSYK